MRTRQALSFFTVAWLVTGAALAAPLGTDFTYQGILADSGVPADGVFDFRFGLWNASSGGDEVATAVEVGDINVTDGRVSVQLDFGDVFDDTALWLAVEVRDGGSTGGYTSLGPRHALKGGPQAHFSRWAASADDAAALGGQAPSYYLSWSNLTGVPGGLDDGDDDTLGNLACGAGEIARWSGATWQCSTDDDSPYVHTYVVGPVGGLTDNGLALLAALDAIPTPAGATQSAVLYVEPGWYELPADTSLNMKPYVDVKANGDSYGMYIDTPGNQLSMDRVTVSGDTALLIRTRNGTTGTTQRAVLTNMDITGYQKGLLVQQYEQTLSVYLRGARLYGGTNTISVLDGDVYVASTELQNSRSTTTLGAGTLTCAGNFSSWYAFYPDTCP